MTVGDYPPSYYAASARPPAPLPGLSGDVTTDVAVIGAGFTGLSAALELSARGFGVCVLESHRIGWGASGRNGGQLLSGGFGAPERIAKRYGAAAGKLAGELGSECVSLVRERIERHRIDCDFDRGAFSAALSRSQLTSLRAEYEARQVHDGAALRWYPKERVREIVGTDRYLGGYLNDNNGHLHPLKLCLAEARIAREAGVRIYEGSPVLALRHGPRPMLRTASGSVTADHLLVCCNAYLNDLEPALSGRVLPAGSFIIATAKLTPETAARLLPQNSAVCDENVLLDYYRLSADRRLLFGGRYSYAGRAPGDIRRALRARMARVFPELRDVGIDYAWGGKVGISLSKVPQIGRITPNVYYAHGYSGHGVAQSHLAGRLLAEVIAGQASRFDVYAAMKSPRLPFGNTLAPPVLAMAFLYARLRDALG